MLLSGGAIVFMLVLSISLILLGISLLILGIGEDPRCGIAILPIVIIHIGLLLLAVTIVAAAPWLAIILIPLAAIVTKVRK